MCCNYRIKDVEDEIENMENYYYSLGHDPRKTLMLYYDEDVNRFFEVSDHDGLSLEPIHDIYRILEPWKVLIFKTKEWSIFPDRTNSFLVEIIWILI